MADVYVPIVKKIRNQTLEFATMIAENYAVEPSMIPSDEAKEIGKLIRRRTEVI